MPGCRGVSENIFKGSTVLSANLQLQIKRNAERAFLTAQNQVVDERAKRMGMESALREVAYRNPKLFICAGQPFPEHVRHILSDRIISNSIPSRDFFPVNNNSVMQKYITKVQRAVKTVMSALGRG